MRPYEPSGQKEPGAVTMAVLLTLLAAGASGAAVHVLATVAFRPMVVVAVAMGAAVGYVGRKAVQGWEIRAPLLAAVLAGAGGAVAWGVDVAIAYGRARAAATARVEELARRVELEDAIISGEPARSRAVNEALRRSGRGRPASELELRAALIGANVTAEDGEVVEPPRRAATTADAVFGFLAARRLSGIYLTTGGGAHLIVLLEIAIAVGLAAAIAHRRALWPYCERCRSWYRPTGEDPIVVAGGDDEERVLEAIEQLDGTALGRLLPARLPRAYIALELASCQTCDDTAFLARLVHIDRPRQDRTVRTVLDRGMLPRALVNDLLDELSRREAPG